MQLELAELAELLHWFRQTFSDDFVSEYAKQAEQLWTTHGVIYDKLTAALSEE